VLARELIPPTQETPATIDAAMPWIRQARALVQPSELQGLARELSPATRDLAAAINGTVTFLPQQNLVAQCLTKVILPTGDIKIDDGPLSTGAENYKEFWYTMVGLSGESQNFDGNGQYVRFQPGGSGTQSFSAGQSSLSGDSVFGQAPTKPIGTRPAYPGKRPPYRPDVPCDTQTIPDLNGAVTGPADGSSQGASATGSGATAPGATSPAVAIPPLPTAASAARSGKGASVAGQLLDRLNPWRKATAKRTGAKRATKKGASR
jgi:hypothetical protein